MLLSRIEILELTITVAIPCDLYPIQSLLRSPIMSSVQWPQGASSDSHPLVSESLPRSGRVAELHQLGLVDYGAAWELQRSLVNQRRTDPNLADVVLMLEHPPVYTLGQGSSLEFLKFAPDDPSRTLWRVERGGEVTYHCPGQLVVYPILNLAFYQKDLHWYLRQLEEVIIRTLGEFGLTGDRIPGLTGVWVEGYKVAAIGIKVSRWITMHGFAVNVCPDLEGFRAIVPCGISDRPVGSLRQFLPEIQLSTVQRSVTHHFADVFHLEWQSE